MTDTGLVVVEGIWGAGKTTTAQAVRDDLETAHHATRLYLEGNLQHPADYDKVACLTCDEYDRLCDMYPAIREKIAPLAEHRLGYYFVYYGKGQAQERLVVSEDVLAELARYDIYDGNLSPARHCEVHVDKWCQFALNQRSARDIVIFECCFLQNPITALMGRYDVSEVEMIDHVLRLSDIIQPLNPILIYLRPENIRTSLQRIFETRSPDWCQGVTDYFIGQGYGHRHGLSGFDGLVQILEKRVELEAKILDRLSIRTCVIEHDGQHWPEVHQQVRRVLGL